LAEKWSEHKKRDRVAGMKDKRQSKKQRERKSKYRKMVRAQKERHEGQE
jgi:hypothetical protein